MSPATQTIDNAVLNRYIKIILDLRNHQDQNIRGLAREVFDTMCIASIEEVLRPIITLPLKDLTPAERFVRLHILQLSRTAP